MINIYVDDENKIKRIGRGREIFDSTKDLTKYTIQRPNAEQLRFLINARLYKYDGADFIQYRDKSPLIK